MAQTYYKTQAEWTAANKDKLNLWRSLYPNLPKGIDFPIPGDYLKNYYMWRMYITHPTTALNDVILNNYDYLLSYFLESYDKTAQQGKDYWDFTKENFPDALGKTFTDFFELIPSWVWIALVGILIIKLSD